MRKQLIATAGCLALLAGIAAIAPQVRAVTVDQGAQARLAAAVVPGGSLDGALSTLGQHRVTVETAMLSGDRMGAVEQKLQQISAMNEENRAAVASAMALVAQPQTVPQVPVVHASVAHADAPATPVVSAATVLTTPQPKQVADAGHARDGQPPLQVAQGGQQNGTGLEVGHEFTLYQSAFSTGVWSTVGGNSSMGGDSTVRLTATLTSINASNEPGKVTTFTVSTTTGTQLTCASTSSGYQCS